MTLPLLQEKAQKYVNKRFPRHWSQADAIWLNRTIEETWNAAITEAIGALPLGITSIKGAFLPRDHTHDECTNALNVVLDDSRTRLEALLKV